MNVYPIRFKPIYKDYIWGGDRIIQRFKRNEPKGRYAESWEICDRHDHNSIVENGSYKGLNISSLLFEWQDKLIGKGHSFKKFPLLVKILDPMQNLSIQVHPDEKSAISLNGEAKAEAWYILESNNSYVYAGFKHDLNIGIFKEAVDSKRVPEILRKIKVKTGDIIDIPGGRVHAICKGSLIFEVQQNSDTTYRIYDWDRLDDENKPRELHLVQAMQVIDFENDSNPKVQPKVIFQDENYTHLSLLKTPFFLIEKISVQTKWFFDSDQSSFQIYFCLKGKATIVADNADETIVSGQTYLIPAYAKETEIINTGDICEVLKITLS